MCGLAGVLSGQARAASDPAVLEAMGRRLVHRGPDDAGCWVESDGTFGVVHQRLAVVDLSGAGHQPMSSACGRWVLAYNGEIYNHLELRRQLEQAGQAPDWRGHSDTETLLAVVAAWGLVEALRQAVGMFALALWDRENRELTLARDRFGEKPLYYGWQGEAFLFGSELKALRPHPAFLGEIDRDALALLLRFNQVPAPWSIHRGVSKLPPGTFLRVSLLRPDATPEAYWSLTSLVEARSPVNPAISEAQALARLEELLGDAVESQLLGDVPVGALLSGGVDSSVIVALMQARSSRPTRTFTIGFQEPGYNEAGHAKAVAAHLGTEHSELYLSPEDLLDLIPRMPDIYCEPFADCSQLPTFMVMQMARQQVTVALSGDGGDELFGGYNRHVLAPRLWRVLGCLPASLRRALAVTMLAPNPAWMDRHLGGFAKHLGVARPGEKLHKLGDKLRHAESFPALYRALVSEWGGAGTLVLGSTEPSTLLDQDEAWPRTGDWAGLLMALDALTYLPDDLLVKVDRAAMAVSLETRAPMLDHRLAEFAFGLPPDLRIRNGRGKYLLRQLLYRHVPRELVDRPKMGFAIPLDEWLRGPLRDWAEELLDGRRMEEQGHLDHEVIRATWSSHQRRDGNHGYRLWSVLMFQQWLAAQQ